MVTKWSILLIIKKEKRRQIVQSKISKFRNIVSLEKLVKINLIILSQLHQNLLYKESL